MSSTSNPRRRNQDTPKPERRNRVAPLELESYDDAIFHQSQLVSELLAFNIHRKRGTFDLCINNINSNDSAVRAQGTKELANMMEIDRRLVQLLTSNDVDRFIEFLVLDKVLTNRDLKTIQYYAAVILTLVFSSKTSSNRLGEVIADKTLPFLMKLLEFENCKNRDVVKQAMSTLTSLIYSFPHSCKNILKVDVWVLLKKIVSHWNDDYQMLVECTLLLGAICKEHPDLSTNERNVAFEIARTILHYETAPEACVPLAKLSDGRRVEVSARDCEVLFQYLDDYLLSKIIYALEVIGNIARWSSGSEIQCMITNGVMQPLQSLLVHDYKIFRREACWIISNIIAVNDKEDVIKTDLVKLLCDRLDNDELEVKLESGYAILNLIYSDSIDIRVLKMICWETLVRQQQCQHLGIVNVCTEAIQMLQDTED